MEMKTVEIKKIDRIRDNKYISSSRYHNLYIVDHGGYWKQADYSKRLNVGERCGRVVTAARAASHRIHQARSVTFVVQPILRRT